MFKAILAGLLIFSSAALADTRTFKVEGMDCQACVDKLKPKVCAIEGLTKCEVEIGKITLASNNETPIDDNAVTNAVQSAGFKVAENSHEGHEGEMCNHKDGKSCGAEGCSCSKDGKKCSCDHSKGGCKCKHGDKHHKGHKAKKKGA